MLITRCGDVWVRIGRVLLWSLFVYGGYHAAKNPGARPAALENVGVPGGENLVRANGAAQALGGAALAIGVVPRAAAAGLIASLVPTTIVGHPYWRETEPVPRQAQTVQFHKNAAMLGGLLLVVSARQD